MIIKIILSVVSNKKLETCVDASKNIFQRPWTFTDFAVTTSGKRVFKCEMTSLGLHWKRVWVVLHIVHFPTLFKLRDLFYNPYTFFIWHIELSSLLNLETWKKLEKKNVGTKNVTVDCSSSTFTAQTDILFKSLKGEMGTTLNQQHIHCTHLVQISQG